MKRRDFLKIGAVSAVYGAMGVSSLKAKEASDYKAIVVLFHAGGNDSLNMFIPSSEDPKKGYPNYHNIRNNIRVEEKELTLPNSQELHLTPGDNPYDVRNDLTLAYTKGFYRHEGLDYATNGLMPELAHLINRGKVAIVANCGNLIEPVTKEQLLSKKKPRPPFLFAHNQQTKLAFNGEASKLDYSGWAGRVYDHWIRLNPHSIYTMTIGINRGGHLLDGRQTSPLIIGSKGPTKYRLAGNERQMYDEFLSLERRDIFFRLYNTMRRHSFDMQDKIVDDWHNLSPSFDGITNAYGQPLFSHPDNATLNQTGSNTASMEVLDSLHAVVRLMKIGKENGLKRQIFYVRDGGYDTHHSQARQHAKKLRGLSLGIGDFYKALEALGMEEDVTLLSLSEFGRSTGNNDDGTDHAWGASYFMLGGAVRGGLYGQMPDLTLGSEDDLTHKGRLIPTTSFTQYYATVLRWFGLEEAEIAQILPELDNFALQDLGCLANG